MAEAIAGGDGVPVELDHDIIVREKRRSKRKPLCSPVSAKVVEVHIEGAGSNVSQTGMYFVSSDDLPVEVCIHGPFGERRVRGRIVRIDAVSDGTMGIAVSFDVRQKDF